MKKYVLSLVVLFILLSACSGKDTVPDGNAARATDGSLGAKASTVEPMPAEFKLEEYFPMAKDIHMKYKGMGNEYAEYETYVDYIGDGVIQTRSMNGGTTTVKVYKLKDGALKLSFVKGETYYRYDYTSSENRDEVLLMEPIKKGTAWILEDGSSRSITAVEKDLSTPAGEYKSLEVTTKRQDSVTRDYYVKGIGLVKSEFTPENGSFSVSSELERLETDVPLKQQVKLFYPEFMKDRVVYIDKVLELYTNENVLERIGKELQTAPENSGLSRVLSQNTRINGAVLNEEKGTVTLDFSPQLVREMNAGTSLEGMILESITNTFGGYYQKDRVVITMEEKPYESGHYLMRQGEFFKVKTDNAVKFERK